MAKKNTKSLLLIGIALLVMLYVMQLPATFSREGLVYDGDNDNFRIKLVDQTDKAIVGNMYSMELEITNTQNKPGKMYVQCSILDQIRNQDWLPVVTQSTVILPQSDNCYPEEYFTQTASVELDGMESESVTYTVRVPDHIGDDNVIWCQSFERCAQQDDGDYDDPYGSSFVNEQLTIYKETEKDSETEYPSKVEDECEVDGDCDSWFSLTDNACVKGKCVDIGNDPELDLSDDTIKGWMAKNKIMILFGSIFFVLIASFFVYQPPKTPRF